MMQDDMVEALEMYREAATSEERQAISQTLNDGFNRMVPPPDSLEGRERRVRQIEREQIMRRVDLDLRYQDVMRRYASR